jgi:hypothetical protein
MGGLYGQNFPHEFIIKIPAPNYQSEADYLVNHSYYASVVVRIIGASGARQNRQNQKF